MTDETHTVSTYVRINDRWNRRLHALLHALINNIFF